MNDPRRFRNYTHRGRIGITEARSGVTGKEGVVVFSEDARDYWFFDNPDDVKKLAKAFEKAATSLMQKQQGATYLMTPRTEVLSSRQYAKN